MHPFNNPFSKPYSSAEEAIHHCELGVSWCNYKPVLIHAESELLGGSLVVISRVISPLKWVITIVTLLITPLITIHESPSSLRSPGRRRCCRHQVQMLRFGLAYQCLSRGEKDHA